MESPAVEPDDDPGVGEEPVGRFEGFDVAVSGPFRGCTGEWKVKSWAYWELAIVVGLVVVGVEVGCDEVGFVGLE